MASLLKIIIQGPGDSTEVSISNNHLNLDLIPGTCPPRTAKCSPGSHHHPQRAVLEPPVMAWATPAPQGLSSFASLDPGTEIPVKLSKSHRKTPGLLNATWETPQQNSDNNKTPVASQFLKSPMVLGPER